MIAPTALANVVPPPQSDLCHPFSDNKELRRLANDILDAIRFYQRRGYHIAAIDPGAIERARRIKPTIPLIGFHGIPIRDELIMVKNLEYVDSADLGGVA